VTRAVLYDFTADGDRDTAVNVAVAALGRGEVIWARVHGVGCLIADAFSPQGVAAALHARTRGRGSGLPVLVRDSSVVHALFAEVTLDATALMTAHWPGGLTLLGVPTPSLQWDIGAAGALSAVAVTMPDSDLVLEIVSAVGPCVYLQAHADSQVQESANSAQARMGDTVAVYLETTASHAHESDPSGARIPTSIVDVRSTPVILRRAGAVATADLQVTCPGLVVPDAQADAQ